MAMYQAKFSNGTPIVGRAKGDVEQEQQGRQVLAQQGRQAPQGPVNYSGTGAVNGPIKGQSGASQAAAAAQGNTAFRARPAPVPGQGYQKGGLGQMATALNKAAIPLQPTGGLKTQDQAQPIQQVQPQQLTYQQPQQALDRPFAESEESYQARVRGIQQPAYVPGFGGTQKPGAQDIGNLKPAGGDPFAPAPGPQAPGFSGMTDQGVQKTQDVGPLAPAAGDPFAVAMEKAAAPQVAQSADTSGFKKIDPGVPVDGRGQRMESVDRSVIGDAAGAMQGAIEESPVAHNPIVQGYRDIAGKTVTDTGAGGAGTEQSGQETRDTVADVNYRDLGRAYESPEVLANAAVGSAGDAYGPTGSGLGQTGGGGKYGLISDVTKELGSALGAATDPMTEQDMARLNKYFGEQMGTYGDISKRYMELMDPAQRAAANAAEREQMLSEVNSQRDREMRELMGRGSRGGSLSAGADIGINQAAQSATAQGMRGLEQDQFQRMLQAYGMGGQGAMGAQQALQDLKGEGFTSNKELAAMLLQYLNPLEALKPG